MEYLNGKPTYAPSGLFYRPNKKRLRSFCEEKAFPQINKYGLTSQVNFIGLDPGKITKVVAGKGKDRA